MLVMVVALSFLWPVQEMFRTWEWLWLYAAVFHCGQAVFMFAWLAWKYPQTLHTSTWRRLAASTVSFNGGGGYSFWVSVLARSGTLMMASGLLFADSPVVVVFSFAGHIIFVPLRRLAEKHHTSASMAFGGAGYLFFAGALLSVWLVSASQTGRIAEGWHWGMLLMFAGGAVDAVNVERNFKFASQIAKSGESEIFWSVLCVASASVIAGAGMFTGAAVFQTDTLGSHLLSWELLAVFGLTSAIGGISTIGVRKGMLETDRIEIFLLMQLVPAASVVCLLGFRQAGLIDISVARWDYYILGTALLTAIAAAVSLGKRETV